MQIKRYEPESNSEYGSMYEDSDGQWVLFEDVEALEKQTRLKVLAEVQQFIVDTPEIRGNAYSMLMGFIRAQQVDGGPRTVPAAEHASWQPHSIIEGYHIWISLDPGSGPLYQVTINDTPPQTDTGYWNLASVLALKGIKQ